MAAVTALTLDLAIRERSSAKASACVLKLAKSPPSQKRYTHIHASSVHIFFCVNNANFFPPRRARIMCYRYNTYRAMKVPYARTLLKVGVNRMDV